ncbi:EamA family transporter [Nitratireductor sp. ZSWI3]|uniref:EamA family transporter n=1 Tax=Nitratireductor sp. ZSWI3 TaxID=2966359 RepID=UPI002150089B|nr:EamA family transporter [Nitratireductor sp. ZSWI3]MCR4265924.1 EamA family transporter [Nitratireductor sp. ZSWI3]
MTSNSAPVDDPAAPRAPSIRGFDILSTAIAPAIWGSTYVVTTELLPAGVPLTVAMLRALPAGIALLVIVRTLPRGIWLWRSFLLGAFNFSVFWWLLFVSAYRLPGGVAATVGAIQPLIVIGLARLALGNPARPAAIAAALVGIAGVALLVLTPAARLDPIGIAAGLGGALSMACGTVLSRKWQPPVSALTFTAWQLTAGGLLLLPVALSLEPFPSDLTAANALGFTWLGLIGAAATYFLWLRGIARLEPAVVSFLLFLSPLTAVVLGWLFLDQTLSPAQCSGMILIVGGIWFGQRSQKKVISQFQVRLR